MEEIKNTAVIIDGMARTGTSALANVVKIFGVDLGNSFIRVQPTNKLGFFEDQQIWRLNHNIRNVLKIDWNDHKQLMLDDEVLTRFNQLHTRFRDSILFRMNKILNLRSNIPLWGFKNPGVSELLSIWIPEISKRNTDIKIIINTRHPADSANSMHDFSKHRKSHHDCLLLWLRYTLGIELRSRNIPRLFVCYEDLMERTNTVIYNLINFLNLEITDDYQTKIAEVNNFLTPSLRNQNVENKENWGHDNGSHDIYQTCLKVYQLVNGGAMTPRDRIFLDEVRRNF